MTWPLAKVILVITPSTSEPTPIVIPLIVDDPFSVRFSATKVASAAAKQWTLPNLPVWADVSVMMIAAG